MTGYKFLLMAGALSALATPSIAEKLTLGHQFAPDSLPGQSAQHFADLVSEKTGGDTTLTVIPGGALGDERANLQQLSNGSLDMALTGTIVLDFMAQPYVLASMPFVYDDASHVLAVFSGEIGQELGSYLADNHRVKSLGWQYVGDRQVTANEPISGVADLDGPRLRLPSGEISAKTWQARGRRDRLPKASEPPGDAHQRAAVFVAEDVVVRVLPLSTEFEHRRKARDRPVAVRELQ